MRLTLFMLTTLLGFTSAAVNLRHTESEECILRVVKQEKEYIFGERVGRSSFARVCFRSRTSKTHNLVKLRSHDKPAECEMDPSDVNGETGVTRGIDASPEQLASLRAMLDSGELAPGESVLVHGPGAEFDDGNIFLLTGLSVTTSLRGRKLGIDNCFENRAQGVCNRNPSCFWHRYDSACEPRRPPARTPPPTHRPTHRPISFNGCFEFHTRRGCIRNRDCVWRRYDGVCVSSLF